MTDVGHLVFEDVVDASKFGLVRALFQRGQTLETRAIATRATANNAKLWQSAVSTTLPGVTT